MTGIWLRSGAKIYTPFGGILYSQYTKEKDGLLSISIRAGYPIALYLDKSYYTIGISGR